MWVKEEKKKREGGTESQMAKSWKAFQGTVPSGQPMNQRKQAQNIFSPFCCLI